MVLPHLSPYGFLGSNGISALVCIWWSCLPKPNPQLTSLLLPSSPASLLLACPKMRAFSSSNPGHTLSPSFNSDDPEHGRARPPEASSFNFLPLSLQILSELSLSFCSPNKEKKGFFLLHPLVFIPSVTPTSAILPFSLKFLPLLWWQESLRALFPRAVEWAQTHHISWPSVSPPIKYREWKCLLHRVMMI